MLKMELRILSGFEFVNGPEEFQETSALIVRIPTGIRSKRTLLAVLADQLAFPGYFGGNWDALYDCLTSALAAASGPLVIVHTDLPFGEQSENRRAYLGVLRDMAQRSATIGSSLRVVFAASDEAAVRAIANELR